MLAMVSHTVQEASQEGPWTGSASRLLGFLASKNASYVLYKAAQPKDPIIVKKSSPIPWQPPIFSFLDLPLASLK